MRNYKDIHEAITQILRSDSNSFVELTKIAGLSPATAFRHANLSGADFSGQDLSGFDFRGARIDDCNFKNALIANAVFSEDAGRREELRWAADWAVYFKKNTSIGFREQPEICLQHHRGFVFISRAGLDRDLAILVARILRESGYVPFLQDEDFGHTSFMARMSESFAEVDGGGRVLALLSRAYMQSDSCLAEAEYSLRAHAGNKDQHLIVLRIEECAPSGFLKQIPYVDLVPLLHDSEAFGRAVSGAIDRTSYEANFAEFYSRSPAQILHPGIRAVPGFTGHEDLLEDLDRVFWQKSGTAALTNSGSASATVKGLGGVGKSVLAREYAWRNRERYHGVWWVRAENQQTIIDDLIDLGSHLIFNLKEIPERNRAVHLALDAIARSAAEKPWLIIYDNVENPDALARLTPAARAHILITSRWPRWQGHAQELPVDVFPEKTAVDFLRAKAPHEPREGASRLAAALGYLPLALSHARAYCGEVNLSFDDYAKRLTELIQEAPEDAEYPTSVFATFNLAITKAAEACPEAERLMQIAAFLEPERIPLDFVTADVMSEKQREKALAALFKVSLIKHETLDDGSRGISMHRLVQKAMRTRLDGVSYNTLLTFVKSEAEARAILAEMLEKSVTPNVVSYNTLLNFVKSEAEARAILAEMLEKGVTPNVVSYSTLLNFAKSEAEARAILAEMLEKGVTPNEITLTKAIKIVNTFEDSLGLIDFFIGKKLFAGRGAFEAAYSKSITHLSAEALLSEYESRRYKFDTALQNPINQYRRVGLANEALSLVLVAPHVSTAQKFYREDYSICKSYFESELVAGHDEDNIYYALGIAAALNRDWRTAKPNLKIALRRSYSDKRIKHIKTLLWQIR